ncbi:MAG: arylesterase [Candidatus Gracilibacteria bacterium]|nr:arylesterase [Candidatus Gracilibacteria bacterium]
MLGVFLTGCTGSSNKTSQKVNNDPIVDELTTKKILALGDSLTAGYNLDIEDSYPAQLEKLLQKNDYTYSIINAGVSGNTSKNLLSRIGLYTEEYDLILLNIGGNDALRSLDIAQLKGNISTIIESFPNTPIILFSIDVPENYGKDYRTQLSQMYKSASESPNVYLYGSFFGGLDYKKHFLADGLHPNTEGYRIISEKIYRFILQYNFIEND